MISREEIIRNEYYWIEIIQNKLYNDLSLYIDKNNISQKEIAKKMGVSKGRVSQLLNGDNMNYKLETIVKLCLAIDKVPSFDLVSINELMNQTNNSIRTKSKTIFKKYTAEYINTEDSKLAPIKIVKLISDYKTVVIEPIELRCCVN
jgi:transcriptional regulator with XRE-family HTH domain